MMRLRGQYLKIFVIILYLAPPFNSAFGQKCPDKSSSVSFLPANEVQIHACIQNQISLGKQSVFWGAKNLTDDRLYIKFTKVVYTTCGNVIRQRADTYLKPREFVGGGTFSGELTFETQVWKEDCSDAKNRISRVVYEDLVVSNISKEEREKEAKVKAQAAAKEKEKAEKERIEREKLQEKENAQKSEKTYETSGAASGSSKESGKMDVSSTPASTQVESEFEKSRRKRLESQKALDASEDAAAAGLLGAVGSAMILASAGGQDDDYNDEDLSFFLRGSVGLGWQEVPVTRNVVYSNVNGNASKESQTSTTGHISADFGLSMAAWNNRFLSFRLNPFFSYGSNAFSEGISGSHLVYGSGASICFGRKFKGMLKGEYAFRTGEIVEESALFDTDLSAYSSYAYSTFKYGVGAMLTFKGRDSYIELNGYRESLSFLGGLSAVVYSYEAKYSFSLMAISIQFSENYPIAGEVAYPGSYEEQPQNYIWFSFYVPFKIFNKKSL